VFLLFDEQLKINYSKEVLVKGNGIATVHSNRMSLHQHIFTHAKVWAYSFHLQAVQAVHYLSELLVKGDKCHPTQQL